MANVELPLKPGLDMTRRIDALLDEVRNSETLLQNARQDKSH